MPNTLEQARASDALKKIRELKPHPERYGNYRSYAESLPATIVMNGLGQAAATLLAQAKGKPEDPHRLLYGHLHEWLCRTDADAPYRGRPELMDAIIESNEADYLLAQAEALAWLVWLKKFAKAYLQRGGDD